MQAFENPEVLKHVERILSYCTAERPELPSDRTAWAMAWLHLVIWNSWKSAYFYADKYPKDDFENYRQYTLLAFQHLAEHHDAEEEQLFPALEERMAGMMQSNEEQHKSFLNELVSIIEYIESTDPNADTPVDFEADKFRSKVDALLLPVMGHLADELDTLDAKQLREHFKEDEIDAINKSSHTGKKGEAAKMLPFILQNLPQPSPFPPAPGFVKTLLAPWVFYWKYRGLWKYAMYPYSPSLEPVPAL